MNSAFVGYEELSRSRGVLSTSAFGLCGYHPPRSMDATILLLIYQGRLVH